METLEDITDQKTAEEELLKRTKLESLGTFADGVAKDFDSLLSAILRNVFLAKISASEEDKILENGLAIAERAGLQAKELAHRLITFAQGGYPVKKLEKLDDLIREAISKALTGSKVVCKPVIAPDLWPAEIDAMQIKQVIENMVANAREAMPEGGVVEVIAENITTGTNIRTLGEGNYVRIVIRDKGIGIPRENLSKIFDPYFTTKEKKGRGGIGLGLAICDSIIKYHNGLISVESVAARHVLFYLPGRRRQKRRALESAAAGGRHGCLFGKRRTHLWNRRKTARLDGAADGRFSPDGSPLYERSAPARFRENQHPDSKITSGQILLCLS